MFTKKHLQFFILLAILFSCNKKEPIQDPCEGLEDSHTFYGNTILSKANIGTQNLRYIDLGASITYRSDQGEYQTLNFLSVDSSYEFYKVYQKTIKEPSPNPCTSAYKYYSFGIGNQVKNMNFKGSNRKMYLNARILARATDFNVSGDSINIVSQEENVVFTFNSDGYLTTFTLPFINKVTWPYQYYDTIILNNETFNNVYKLVTTANTSKPYVNTLYYSKSNGIAAYSFNTGELWVLEN